jgi:hypothetical protein
MDTSDSSGVIGPGTWHRPAHVDAGYCRSATPCCNHLIAVPLDDLAKLGSVTIRCPTCAKQWDMHYDPWTPGHDALWIN